MAATPAASGWKSAIRVPACRRRNASGFSNHSEWPAAAGRTARHRLGLGDGARLRPIDARRTDAGTAPGRRCLLPPELAGTGEFIMTFPFIDAWPRRLFWLCCLLSLGACAQPRRAPPRRRRPSSAARMPTRSCCCKVRPAMFRPWPSRAGKAAAAVAYWGCCNSSKPGKPR